MRIFRMSGKRESGFTLIEMMITIAVFSILAMIAIPTFMTLLPGMRLNGSARDIFVVMNQVRMGAVAKNTVGVIKFDLHPNNTFTAWLDDPAGAAGLYEVGTDILIKSGPTESGVSISSTTFPSHTFGYNSRGLPAGTPGAYYVRLENSKLETQDVQVNALGIIKMP